MTAPKESPTKNIVGEAFDLRGEEVGVAVDLVDRFGEAHRPDWVGPQRGELTVIPWSAREAGDGDERGVVVDMATLFDNR